MKKGMNPILTLLLATSLIAMSVTPVMAANRKTIDYVAFGDSVAAGVRGGNAAPGDPSYELKSQYGYTNIIANDLSHSDNLSNFSKDKNLCRSGMTAAELARTCESIHENKYTHEYNLVKNAEIVTLDIGANDLLGPLYDYVNTYGITYNEAELNKAIGTIMYNLSNPEFKSILQSNIETILTDVMHVNKNVKIYMMLYYNPIPALSPTLLTFGVDLDTLVNSLNDIILSAINNVDPNHTSITTIDTTHLMNPMDPLGSAENLFPTDIHPTEAGYQAIADKFWSEIEPNLPNAK